ncbi:ZIP family metal transporter [Solibacillus sp. FSL H8-0538]|uniref:ZIP family metal transporter n=1 Tax=Solibacillus sp. FSL H8-0538 TaxID=2921400 RepID=UPI0030FB15D7
MMVSLKFSLMIMVLVFFGTVIGGGLAKFISTTLRGNSRYLLLFCGGILAGLLLLDLIPESIHTYKPIGIVLGVTIGIIFMLLLHIATQNIKMFRVDQSTNYLLLFVALLFHGIPTGIALGMSYQNEQFQNPSLLLAILFHHVPEGMTMMVAVLISKFKLKTFFLLSLLLSFSIMVTTFIGSFINSDNLRLYTLFLGAAIGTLSYITFYEILWKELKSSFTVKLIAFALSGMLFYYFYHITVFQH